ncbi:hypothetical protein [Rubellicoccus peritrichatus]|uniref:PEP-CTERM protein-sorting domain-containing protein n=1 Tax=Rubellicoccus peritrichatus TaxID=3080537 RepID=A0AAQ3QRS6_9BACT|nr:hypothetical protein [Puniceicoccus sp. CR14]WOO41588.1 hypothetical protein RZN69_00705 [Puniceicoccus sp. CR14]
MNTIRPWALFVGFAVILCSGSAYGALTMTVNSSTKTLAINGTSTAGTPDFGFSVAWQTTVFPVAPDDQTLDISAALQLTGTTLSGADIEFSGPAGIATVGLAGDGAFSEISGTGTNISYAILTSGLQQSLETYAASNPTIDLEAGSGFGDIQVQLVPEPKLYAFVVGLGALCLVVTLRRRN